MQISDIINQEQQTADLALEAAKRDAQRATETTLVQATVDAAKIDRQTIIQKSQLELEKTQADLAIEKERAGRVLVEERGKTEIAKAQQQAEAKKAAAEGDANALLTKTRAEVEAAKLVKEQELATLKSKLEIEAKHAETLATPSQEMQALNLLMSEASENAKGFSPEMQLTYLNSVLNAFVEATKAKNPNPTVIMKDGNQLLNTADLPRFFSMNDGGRNVIDLAAKTLPLTAAI